MAVTVRIPTALSRLTEGKLEVPGEGRNIQDLIEHLEAHYTGIKERLTDENGGLRPFVNLYVNEEDVRFLDSIRTALKDGDRVSIVPAIAGG